MKKKDLKTAPKRIKKGGLECEVQLNYGDLIITAEVFDPIDEPGRIDRTVAWLKEVTAWLEAYQRSVVKPEEKEDTA